MSSAETSRAGRACGTCLWFKPHTQEQKDRFVPGDGFCGWRGPPIIEQWGRNNPARAASTDWCSEWVPNMAEI